MAEEFVLSVSVDADMAPFRRTLRQELDAAQRAGATVPVGAGAAAATAAGTSIVPPGAATAHPGAAATASAVARQSATAVAATAARAGLPFAGTIPGMPGAQFTASGGMIGPGAAPMLPSAGGGWPGGWQQWGAPPVPSPVPVPTPPPAPPRPGNRPPRPSGGAGFFGGSERFITGAFLANSLGNALETEMEFARDQRFAGGDPTALIEADLRRRQSMADAFPVAGRLGRWGRELMTGEEEAVRKTLRQVEKQEERIGLMQQRQAYFRETRGIGEVARAGSTFEQRTQAILNDYDTRIADDRKKLAEAEVKAREPFAGQRAEVARRTQEQLNAVSRRGGASADAINAAKAQVLAGEREELLSIERSEQGVLGNIRRQFSVSTSNIEAHRNRQLLELDRESDLRRRRMSAETNRFAGMARGLPMARATERQYGAAIDEIEFEEEGAAFGPEAAAALRRRQDAVSVARERSWLRADRLAATLNSGEQRASFFGTANQPLQAALARQVTALGAEIFNAPTEERQGIAARGMQQIAERVTAFGRQFGANQRAQAAQQQQLEHLLNRNPLAAELTGIAFETGEAERAAEQWPPGFRQLAQWSARGVGNLRSRFATQKDADARAQRLTSLQARSEVFGLQAEGRELSARSTAMQRSTELELAAARRAGRGEDEQRAILESGINEQRAFERQLRRRMNAGFGTEVAAGSFAPGHTTGDQNEPVIKAIERVEKAIGELQRALTGS